MKRFFASRSINLSTQMSPTVWRFDPIGPEGHPSRKGFRGPLKAAILDWSGTTADQHVLAPAVVFFDVFKKHGVEITMEEARLPMGLRKDLHIGKILEIPEVKERWTKIKGEAPTQATVDMLFDDFVPMQLECLGKYTSLIPGTAETVRKMKDDYGMKIGSTTGFTKVMVDILLSDAEKQGYTPDSSVAGDQVENNMGFRPAPFMIYKNLVKMGVYPIDSVVKVDDTTSGVGEGLNAGCWTVGLAGLSNYTNIDSNEQWDAMSDSEKEERVQQSRDILFECGAHYVADSIRDMPTIIEDINKRLAAGEKP